MDINVKELNKKDPLLAEWALLRIDYLQYIDKEEAEKFAEEFFHKEAVRYLRRHLILLYFHNCFLFWMQKNLKKISMSLKINGMSGQMF